MPREARLWSQPISVGGVRCLDGLVATKKGISPLASPEQAGLPLDQTILVLNQSPRQRDASSPRGAGLWWGLGEPLFRLRRTVFPAPPSLARLIGVCARTDLLGKVWPAGRRGCRCASSSLLPSAPSGYPAMQSSTKRPGVCACDRMTGAGASGIGRITYTRRGGCVGHKPGLASYVIRTSD